MFSMILASNTSAIESLWLSLPPSARRALLAESEGDIGALRLARIKEVVNATSQR